MDLKMVLNAEKNKSHYISQITLTMCTLWQAVSACLPMCMLGRLSWDSNTLASVKPKRSDFTVLGSLGTLLLGELHLINTSEQALSLLRLHQGAYSKLITRFLSQSTEVLTLAWFYIYI